MSSKKLEIKLYGSWSTYAVFIMSTLESCGMWDVNDTYQEFLGETCIGFQILIHKNCSTIAVTYYDWKTDHTYFMNSIGVKTESCMVHPGDADYDSEQEKAISNIKASIDNGRAVIVWGIDTGEFGIIHGYDDEDGVFFTLGVNSLNSTYSDPILYENLGKTFEFSPWIYYQYPVSNKPIPKKEMIKNSLKYYVEHMEGGNSEDDYTIGLAAYDHWINSLSGDFDSFGLRYCSVIYWERKDSICLYMNIVKRYFPDNVHVEELQTLFSEIARLYLRLREDVLNQGLDGPGDLCKPVTKDMAKEAVKVILDIKSLEEKAVKTTHEFLRSL